MSALVILVAVAYVALEWLAAVWLASLIGWGWVLVVFAGFVVLGAAVMRRAGAAAMRSLGSAPRPGVTGKRPDGAAVGDASLLFLAGALIALPGLVTSAFGLALLVRPLRRVLGAGIVVWFTRRFRLRGMSMRTTYDAYGNPITRVVPGDVVQGDVVPDPPTSAHKPDRPVIEG